MAQRTVVPRAFTFPIPENVNDDTAAALPNPGISAWLSLAYRAKLVRGENVLILGATGVTGRLAVKIAGLLGAARVVAAGRNQQVLNTLHDLGADATISLALPETELSEAFVREAGQSGFQVVIDYVWGHPAQAFLTAITRREFVAIQSETRFVQVGESAAPTITLPAAVLRSTSTNNSGYCGDSSSRRSGRSLSASDGVRRQRGPSDRHRKGPARGYRERLAAPPARLSVGDHTLTAPSITFGLSATAEAISARRHCW